MTPDKRQDNLYEIHIDGIRALAVILVLYQHLYHPEYIRGYMGVDMFFVVSGYLVSTQVFNGRTTNIWTFYRKRILRIVPIFLFITIFTLLVGCLFLFPNEQKKLAKHVLSSALFASNYVFQSEAGYFDDSSLTKPLLHTWSLSVEEQFYLLIPLVIFYINRGRSLLITLSLLTATSFGIYVYYSASDLDARAYFSFESRFWELALGVLAAKAMPTIRKFLNGKSSLAQLAIHWAALFIFSVSLFSFNHESNANFFRILVVISTIYFITKNNPDNLLYKFLSISAMRWTGKLSYPIYLIHWPLISYTLILNNSQSISFLSSLLIIVITFSSAAIIHKYIEAPLRASKSKILPFAFLIGLVLTAILGEVNRKNSSEVFQLVKGQVARNGDIGHDTYSSYSNSLENLCRLSTTSSPSCPDLRKDRQETYLIIGDSHGDQVAVGLAMANPNAGVVFVDTQGLPVFGNNFSTGFIESAIHSTQPDKILITSYWLYRTTEHSNPYTLLSEFLLETKKIRQSLYILSDTPRFSFEPHSCKFNGIFGRISSCTEELSNLYDRQNTVNQHLQSTANLHSIKFLDIWNAFCEEAVCKMADNDNVWFRDNNHLNLIGGKILGSYILQHLGTMRLNVEQGKAYKTSPLASEV